MKFTIISSNKRKNKRKQIIQAERDLTIKTLFEQTKNKDIRDFSSDYKTTLIKSHKKLRIHSHETKKALIAKIINKHKFNFKLIN